MGRPLPDDCLFHIIPVPLEQTVSYGTGTAGGPDAILHASQQLEGYDGIDIPAEQGIFTHPPLSCKGSMEDIVRAISDTVSGVLQLGKIPVLLGGEHSISLGALQAVRKIHGNAGVVQFDAHADLRDSYEGSRFSHACVMRRALELELPLFQVGVRSLSYEEELLRRQEKIGRLDAVRIAETGIPEKILPEDFPESLYLTIDVDVLDPSIMPATGTPEPGGLDWYQLMKAIGSVLGGRRVVGFDVVELAPVAGLHAPDFTAARLIYAVFGMIGRNVLP